ncbi:MAG: MATE family efflux transporter [Bacteroidales bacterium]|nr:MATE family efflux transporter [Bacteroidales bacterium]
MKSLDREILRLAVPSILANITVPLVGLVDTAVAGHLHSAGASGAEFIGGISVGAMILSVVYWNFAFLRASTGGLTAQAYGRLVSLGLPSSGLHISECLGILRRALGLAMGFALLLVALGWPLSRLALIFRDATPSVAALAIQYILIRIWAAPATLSLMALKGWFIGMQDSVSSMLTDLTVNAVNIAASIILSLGIGSWDGLGFIGIPLGTVIAQYSGLLLAMMICWLKYHAFAGRIQSSQAGSMKDFFKLNSDLFIRSLCFSGIYLGYTIIASQFGEVLLACANIMMNLLMIFSYFTDGFAYAGEALTGRFIGEKDPEMLKRTVRGTFKWSFGVAGFWMLIYWIGGPGMLGLMTDDAAVLEACRRYLPWLLIMPPVGCAAFTWDGIYIGATASKAIRNAMIWALVAFLGIWYAGRVLLPGLSAPAAIHLLMAAYFAHLAARTIHLSLAYHKNIRLS